MNRNNNNETIEEKIMKKIELFYSIHKYLRFEMLNDFLETIDLSDVFVSEEDKEIIWNIFCRISDHSEIDIESCKKGILEIFAFYGVTDDIKEETNRDSINKDKKLDELLTRISISNTDKPKKKPKHERKITMIFNQIKIDKLQQLRKIFSLLDLRNKEYVYINELQDVLKKYKFIKLTQDELINFLSIISDDLKVSLDGKLSINFELYSRAMSAIEKQILHESDAFSEKNDSIEVFHDCSTDIIEDLSTLELESIDYTIVLSEMIKSLEICISDNILDTYERLNNKIYYAGETDTSMKEYINESIRNLKSKVNDFSLFLKEMNKLFRKKENKIEQLRINTFKTDSNLKNLEEDYVKLFKQYNTNQPVDINDEAERLLDEISSLNIIIEKKENEIENLNKRLNSCNDQLFNVQNKLEESLDKEKEYKTELLRINHDNKELKKNYDALLNDIYEKIQNEQEVVEKKEVKQHDFKDKLNYETIIKLREKLIQNEEIKKIFEMNYEQLVIYTCNSEMSNKQLEELKIMHESRIKELEKELNTCKMKYNDIQKQLNMLKFENTRLLNKNSELVKDIELNQLCRPSMALINRISRTSKFEYNPVNNLKNIKLFESKNEAIITPSKNTIKDKNYENIISYNINLQENNNKQIISAEEINTPSKQTDEIIINKAINEELNQGMIESLENLDGTEYENKNETKYIELKEETPNKYNNLFTNKTEIDYSDYKNKKVDNIAYRDTSITNNNSNIFGKEESGSSSMNDKYLFGKKEDESYMEDSYKDSIISKNIIVDYFFDSNPFEKNTDNYEDNNVNLKVFSKNSNHDLNYEEYQKKRKQKEISKKKPSLIKEEVEEDERDKKSLKNEDVINPGHNRMKTIDDIGLVYNKDSEYMCYDFLTLRKNMAVIKLLEDNWEDVSSYEMFSDNIYLIDESNKKSKKYLFITSNSIYILKPYDVSMKLRVNLKNLVKITISNKNCNLIALHFKDNDDVLIEILRRMELLYYFRDLYRMKSFGKIKFKYSDHFTIKRNNGYSDITVNQANNFQITPNFENAHKLGYLSKLSGGLFSRFLEKLVVLTNIGLLYFDDPSKPPKKIIPIIGSEIKKLDEKKYKRKHCFEIKSNGEYYVFGTKTEEELDSWMAEFNKFTKSYEKKMKNI